MAINNPPFVSGRVHRGGELRLYPAIFPFHPPLRPLDRADDEAHGAEQAGDGGGRLAGVTAEQVRVREAIGGLLAQISDQAVGPKVGHAHLERVLALL